MEFYLHFSLLMDRSPGFGSMATNFIRPIQTWFPFGSAPSVLNLASQRNSPDHSTKGTISHIDVLYVLVSTEFQVLFTPLPGYFSPFPHGTAPLSVTE